MTERTATASQAGGTGTRSSGDSAAGRALVTGLGLLPDRDRALVELVDLAGLRPKEAAAVLGVTPGAVRMRLMRARAQLRRQAITTNQTRGDDHD